MQPTSVPRVEHSPWCALGQPGRGRLKLASSNAVCNWPSLWVSHPGMATDSHAICFTSLCTVGQFHTASSLTMRQCPETHNVLTRDDCSMFAMTTADLPTPSLPFLRCNSIFWKVYILKDGGGDSKSLIMHKMRELVGESSNPGFPVAQTEKQARWDPVSTLLLSPSMPLDCGTASLRKFTRLRHK